jgi:branched-chain amino acid transport system ATP-binding protein
MFTIKRIKNEGVAALVVEQHAETVLSVSDRVYVMDHGAIVHEGPAEELLRDQDKRKRLLGI